MAITFTILSVSSTFFKLCCRYQSTFQLIFIYRLHFTYLIPDKKSKNQIHYANNYLKYCTVQGITSGKYKGSTIK